MAFGGSGGAVPHTMETIMQPQTVLAIALVVGAVLGTLFRIWASPTFQGLFNKQLAIEAISNGAVALVIPYAAALPILSGIFPDMTTLKPIPGGAIMFFVAMGSGDWFGNIRKKIGGLFGGGS